ncbi:MAG: SCO family protein [Acidobacteriota bacterium]
MSGSNYSAQAEHPDAQPLVQFSVHSLPNPADSPAARTRRGRMKMLIVWAVCAAPVVASYFTYYVIRPQGRTNYGALIQPPVAIPADAHWALQDLQGQSVLPSSLKGQWLLISVAGGECNATCEAHLYQQRQLREILGKDKDRLDRVWLVTDPSPVRPSLLPALAQSWVLRAPEEAVRRWLHPEPGHALSEHLYLVDPRGDWMMRFPAQADPSKIKKDLTRLMKANESWDQAGR